MPPKRWVPERLVVLSVSGLLIIGFLNLYSVYMGQSYAGEISSVASQLTTYLVGLGIGLVCAYLVYRSNIKLYRALSYPIYILAVSLLMLVFIPSIGSPFYRRWIYFGGFSFQPSEFAKIAVILVSANYLTQRDASSMSFRETLTLLSMVALVALLIVIEPSLSASVMIVMIFSIQYYLSGAKVWVLFVLGGLFGIGIFVQSLVDIGMWKSRFLAVLDPIGTSGGAGFQLRYSLVGIASGGFFGRGLFFGKQRILNYVESIEADFVFTNIAEEFGFIGSAFVILLFVIFLIGAIKIASRSRNQFTYLVALGIAIHIGMQAFFNIGIAIGLLPTTGAQLPFISAGSSSLIVNLVEVGILFGIDRYSHRKKIESLRVGDHDRI